MIEKTLVLSTAHISEQTSKLLERYSEINVLPFRLQSHSYGYIIFVSPTSVDEWDEGEKEMVPQELMDIYLMAQQQGCTMINLDRDADTVDGLKIFEW